MIKIIKGTFGYNDGKKVIPITGDSDPIELDAAQEARLVKKGVAVYVATPSADTETANDGLPVYNESMKLQELRDIAEACGVDASKVISKAKVIELIEASITVCKSDDEAVEDDESETTAEAPPSFDAEMPVEA